MRVVPLRCHRHHLVRLAVVTCLMALAASTGCSSSTNVTVQAQFASGPSNPADTNGDGNNDNWTDTTLTPTGFAVAIQSAKLTCCQASNTTDTPASFTIFDEGVNANNLPNALFNRLYNSPTKVIIGSAQDVDTGTYDTLELQLVYYETEVDTYQDNNLHRRRLRTYFQDYMELLTTNSQTAKAQDQLISDGTAADGITPQDFVVPTSGDPADVGSTDMNMRWINPTNGSRCPTRSTCNGGTPYPAVAGLPGSTLKIDLTAQKIVVDSSTDTNFIITVTAQIENLFFYDETDADGQFNYLTPLPPASPSSYEGKIQAACTVSDCSTGSGGGNKQEADFGIGPPKFSVDIQSQ